MKSQQAQMLTLSKIHDATRNRTGSVEEIEELYKKGIKEAQTKILVAQVNETGLKLLTPPQVKYP